MCTLLPQKKERVGRRHHDAFIDPTVVVFDALRERASWKDGRGGGGGGGGHLRVLTTRKKKKSTKKKTTTRLLFTNASSDDDAKRHASGGDCVSISQTTTEKIAQKIAAREKREDDRRGELDLKKGREESALGAGGQTSLDGTEKNRRRLDGDSETEEGQQQENS